MGGVISRIARITASHRLRILLVALLVCLQAVVAGPDSKPEASGLPSDGRHLIPEILVLPDFGNIPQSVLDRYDTRSIGESIAWRIATHDENGGAARPSEMAYDMMADADILLHFGMADFDSIMRKGFLNQHQTGKSKGSYTPSHRNDTDQTLMGVKLGHYNSSHGDPKHFIRPKYAALQFNAPVDVGRYDTSAAKHYGDVIAVMKPEVKRRATWTYLDSLGVAGSCSISTCRGSQGTFFRKSIARMHPGSYPESQIFGEVTFADVQYLMVTDSVSKSDIKRLEATGLPIYYCSPSLVHGRTIYSRGKQYYKGDADKLIAYQVELQKAVRGFEGSKEEAEMLKKRLGEARTAAELVAVVHDVEMKFPASRNHDLETVLEINIDRFLTMTPTAADFHALQRELIFRPKLREKILEAGLATAKNATDYYTILRLPDDAAFEDQTWLDRFFAKHVDAFLALDPSIDQIAHMKSRAGATWEVAEKMMLQGLKKLTKPQDYINLSVYPIYRVNDEFKASSDKFLEAHLDAYFALRPTMEEMKKLESERLRTTDKKVAFTRRLVPFVKSADDYLKLIQLTFKEPSRKYWSQMTKIVDETLDLFASFSPTPAQIEEFFKTYPRLKDKPEIRARLVDNALGAVKSASELMSQVAKQPREGGKLPAHFQAALKTLLPKFDGFSFTPGELANLLSLSSDPELSAHWLECVNQSLTDRAAFDSAMSQLDSSDATLRAPKEELFRRWLPRYLASKPEPAALNEILAFFPEAVHGDFALVQILSQLPADADLKGLKLPPSRHRSKPLQRALDRFKGDSGSGLSGVVAGCVTWYRKFLGFFGREITGG